MNERDEVIQDIGYTKFVVRHFTNAHGEERSWGMIRFNVYGPAALVLPVTNARTVVLERSYRIPMKAHVIELPGGSNDVEGETLQAVAARELCEETGYTGGEYRQVGMIPESPGGTDQMIALYIAQGVERTRETSLGADEVIEVLEIPLSKVLSYLRTSSDPVDPKVYAAIMLLPKELLQEVVNGDKETLIG